jgi:hypothetical protein
MNLIVSFQVSVYYSDRTFRNFYPCLQMINMHDCYVFILVFVYYIKKLRPYYMLMGIPVKTQEMHLILYQITIKVYQITVNVLDCPPISYFVTNLG